MTDRPRPTGGDDGGIEYDRDSTGMPRWVKLAGLVVAVVVVLVVVIMLLDGGGGGHGPQRHGGRGGATAPGGVTAWVHR